MSHWIEKQIDELKVVCALQDIIVVKNWRLVFQIYSHNFVAVILVRDFFHEWNMYLIFWKYTWVDTILKQNWELFHNTWVKPFQHLDDYVIISMCLTWMKCFDLLNKWWNKSMEQVLSWNLIEGLNKFNICVHWFWCTWNGFAHTFVCIKQSLWVLIYIIYFTMC